MLTSADRVSSEDTLHRPECVRYQCPSQQCACTKTALLGHSDTKHFIWQPVLRKLHPQLYVFTPVCVYTCLYSHLSVIGTCLYSHLSVFTCVCYWHLSVLTPVCNWHLSVISTCLYSYLSVFTSVCNWHLSVIAPVCTHTCVIGTCLYSHLSVIGTCL